MVKTRNTSSGAGPVGGYNFQAAVSAIAYAHMIRGTPVIWTKGYSGSVPIRVDSETNGPGDDISLELADGKTVEIQAKKGLKADKTFWIAINSLCEGINSNRCDFAMLIVCPFSSRTISRDYARAIKRIGNGRLDPISKQQEEITRFLIKSEYDPTDICSRLRILTVSAIDEHGDAVAAAHAELGHICTKDSHIPLVWNVLYEEALKAIEYKSSRNCSSLASVLSSLNLMYDIGADETPVALSKSLLEWIESTTVDFTVPGISDPLSIDKAWLELQASVGDNSVDPSTPTEDALKAYHQPDSKSSLGSSEVIDAKTIGTFRNLCVITGGPGSGKSLLTKVLAREFGREGLISLQIKLRDLANKIHYTGCAVEEGMLSLGLDGSGVSPANFHSIGLPNVVLLCDGLDESGHYQSTISEGLCRISRSKPSYRIIVTTRQIGYFAIELKHWRHYYIRPLKSENTKDHLSKLCLGVTTNDPKDSNELQTKIDANLQTVEGFKSVFTNPLLCAFAAALVLNGYKIGKSKKDLYKRIFKLLDEKLDPRKSDAANVPIAIRNRVLNHLGWLATTSPLRSSQETESLCAERIALVTSKPDLDALVVTEESILYWEKTGIIEKLHHSGHDLIVFTHKSCGEFAGARFLETIDKDDARQLIESELEKPELEETLYFATQISVAALVAETAIDKIKSGEPKRHLINCVLHALVRNKNCIDPTKLTSFLDQVFAVINSEDRQKAYTVGLCLVEHDLRHLNEVVDHAKKLQTADSEWSNLIGWSVLVCHFRDELDPIELENTIFHYVKIGDDDNFFSQSIHDSYSKGLIDWLLRDRPDKEVFERFLCGGLEITIENLTRIKRTELFVALQRLKNKLSNNFAVFFESLLIKFNREDLIRDFEPHYNVDFKGFNRLHAAHQVLLHKVVAGAFVNKKTQVPPFASIRHLGALIQLTLLLKVPANDAHVWTDVDDYSRVRYLLRIAASVYRLSLERLAAEARFVINNDYTEAYFAKIPSVDPCEVDWNRAKRLDINDDFLEEMVLHPSIWVAYLAANILNQRFTRDGRLEACNRLFGNGQGRALQIAAHFACQLPNNEGHELIVSKLETLEIPEAHYLFDKLAEDEFQVEYSHKNIVELGLFSSSEVVAKSASNWCCKCMGASENWLMPLLRKAFQYWKTHEPTYPKKGGIVPESPREVLYLKLSSSGIFKFEELTDLTKDDRPEISRHAVQDLVALAIRSEVDRSHLVEKTCRKHFSPEQCLHLFKTNIPYSRENLVELCTLLNEVDPHYRQVALQILSHPNIDNSEALKLATKSKGDSDGNVRDAAFKILDQLSVLPTT